MQNYIYKYLARADIAVLCVSGVPVGIHQAKGVRVRPVTFSLGQADVAPSAEMQQCRLTSMDCLTLPFESVAGIPLP